MTNTRDIFELLGFEQDWQAMTDNPPAYRVDLGNIDITASEVMGRHFRPVFLLMGTVRTAGIVGIINSELPLEVENFEQGVALIARLIGEGIEPEKHAPWFAVGKRWQHHLALQLKRPR